MSVSPSPHSANASAATAAPLEAGTSPHSAGLPEPIRFKLVIQKRGLLFGVLLDLAIEVMFQQFGIAAFDFTSFLRAILIGTAIGIVMPTLGHSIGGWFANRELRRLRSDLDARDAAVSSAIPADAEEHPPSFLMGGEEE